jgi:ATP-dependent DNA helicase RecG
MNYGNLVGDLEGNHQDTHQDTHQDKLNALVEYCSEPKTRDEMQQFIGLTDRGHFRKTILNPLLKSKRLVMTVPDKPNSRNQKYVRGEVK